MPNFIWNVWFHLKISLNQLQIYVYLIGIVISKWIYRSIESHSKICLIELDIFLIGLI